LSRLAERVGSATLRVGVAAVTVLAVLPLAYLILRAAGLGARLPEILFSPRTGVVLWNSVRLTAAVTLSATAIGVALAWLTVRTDLPGRRFWSIACCLPLVLPSYVGAYALMAAFGPGGELASLWAPIGLPGLPRLEGFGGAWFALTLFTFPYVTLCVRAGLRGLDPNLEEAARALGRSGRQVFREIMLPHLRPFAAAGALLVALYTLSDFGAVALLRFDAFTRAIYVQYTGSLDRGAASVLALLLVALTLVIMSGEYRWRGRFRHHRLGPGAARSARRARLGLWRWPALAFCALLALFGAGIPAGVIVVWLVQGGWPADAAASVGPLLGNSVLAASLAALACAAAALPLALFLHRRPGALARWVERAAYLGHALPGVVVGLALVFFGARAMPALYQTLTLLVVAYTVLFLPLALGALRGSLQQISPRLEEAARTLGRGPVAAFGAITLPLLRPGLWSGLALVFLSCLKELPATLMLSPFNFSTLATRIWGATEEAFFARAALPALVLVAVSCFSLWIIFRQEEKGTLSS
jgi:iron(III) transport system permease protein